MFRESLYFPLTSCLLKPKVPLRTVRVSLAEAGRLSQTLAFEKQATPVNKGRERGRSAPFREESAGCRRDGGAWAFLCKGQRLCRADSAALSLVTFEPDAHCGCLPLLVRKPPVFTLQLGQ